MKHICLTALFMMASAAVASAEQDVITLDLAKATTELKFNVENGSWTGTYDDDEESIESQCFSFVHSSMGDYDAWWDFTASNSADNSKPENTLTQQWSAMAKGGIVLDENGEVKKDSFGAPVVSADVPYIVGYYNAYFSRRPTDMTFNDGLYHEAVGVYVNLNSYAYYSLTDGDGMARAFTNGDKLTLKIHGVGVADVENFVEVTLGAYDNGDLTATRGWKYVDLSSLGAVNEIYFTMESTDTGVYGMNTPGYFCLDKLMVKAAPVSGVESLTANGTLTYDRATKTLTTGGAEFTMVCNTLGQMIISGDSSSFDLSSLPAGVYVAKTAGKTLKFAK